MIFQHVLFFFQHFSDNGGGDSENEMDSNFLHKYNASVSFSTKNFSSPFYSNNIPHFQNSHFVDLLNTDQSSHLIPNSDAINPGGSYPKVNVSTANMFYPSTPNLTHSSETLSNFNQYLRFHDLPPLQYDHNHPCMKNNPQLLLHKNNSNSVSRMYSHCTESTNHPECNNPNILFPSNDKTQEYQRNLLQMMVTHELHLSDLMKSENGGSKALNCPAQCHPEALIPIQYPEDGSAVRHNHNHPHLPINVSVTSNDHNDDGDEQDPSSNGGSSCADSISDDDDSNTVVSTRLPRDQTHASSNFMAPVYSPSLNPSTYVVSPEQYFIPSLCSNYFSITPNYPILSNSDSISHTPNTIYSTNHQPIMSCLDDVTSVLHPASNSHNHQNYVPLLLHHGKE